MLTVQVCGENASISGGNRAHPGLAKLVNTKLVIPPPLYHPRLLIADFPPIRWGWGGCGVRAGGEGGAHPAGQDAVVLEHHFLRLIVGG